MLQLNKADRKLWLAEVLGDDRREIHRVLHVQFGLTGSRRHATYRLQSATEALTKPFGRAHLLQQFTGVRPSARGCRRSERHYHSLSRAGIYIKNHPKAIVLLLSRDLAIAQITGQFRVTIAFAVRGPGATAACIAAPASR